MNENSILNDKLFTKHGKEVERVFREAVRQALRRHKRLGQSVAASRDGKVVIVPPEEIPVDDQPVWQASKTPGVIPTDGQYSDDNVVELIKEESNDYANRSSL
jgi:hypothetical protein